MQAKPLLQRDASPEDEELVQTKRLLLREAAPEEEEAVQAKRLLQREGSEEEEEPIQAKRLVSGKAPKKRSPSRPNACSARRKKRSRLQAKRLPIQREAEEEEPLQAKRLALQREAGEEEELIQGKRGLQREAEEEEIQTQPEEEEIQARRGRPDPLGSFDAGPAVETRVQASSGSGSPLPGPLREYMEPRLARILARSACTPMARRLTSTARSTPRPSPTARTFISARANTIPTLPPDASCWPTS